MPIYVTCLFVFCGALLDFFNVYDRLVDFSGAGAMLPITSFGHTVVHGVMEEVETLGVTYSYEFRIWLEDNGTDQNIEQGKTFNGKIVVNAINK